MRQKIWRPLLKREYFRAATICLILKGIHPERRLRWSCTEYIIGGINFGRRKTGGYKTWGNPTEPEWKVNSWGQVDPEFCLYFGRQSHYGYFAGRHRAILGGVRHEKEKIQGENLKKGAADDKRRLPFAGFQLRA